MLKYILNYSALFGWLSQSGCKNHLLYFYDKNNRHYYSPGFSNRLSPDPSRIVAMYQRVREAFCKDISYFDCAQETLKCFFFLTGQFQNLTYFVF